MSFLSVLTAFVAVLVIIVGVAWYYGRRYLLTAPGKDKVFTVFDAPTPQSPAKGATSTAGPIPTLSIVVPCYNEQDRLPPMLTETIQCCEGIKQQCAASGYDDAAARKNGWFRDYEIVVVDDCSKDGTKEVVKSFQAKFAAAGSATTGPVKIKLVALPVNHGKGYAVRTGFFVASGDYVLMADGDNATKIDDVKELFKAVRKPLDGAAASTPLKRGSLYPPVIAVGSRAHLEQPSMAQRTFFRTLLMKIFHVVVAVTYFLGTRGTVCAIRDTQCGFKLFDRRICEVLFLNNRLERWAFDVELFICCKRLRMETAEVSVNWQEIPGSKVRLMGMAQMGLECVLMAILYVTGLWKVHRKAPASSLPPVYLTK